MSKLEISDLDELRNSTVDDKIRDTFSERGFEEENQAPHPLSIRCIAMVRGNVDNVVKGKRSSPCMKWSSCNIENVMQEF